jgi:hypothetical protein
MAMMESTLFSARRKMGCEDRAAEEPGFGMKAGRVQERLQSILVVEELQSNLVQSLAPCLPNTQARMSMGRQAQRIVECLTAQTEHVLKERMKNYWRTHNFFQIVENNYSVPCQHHYLFHKQLRFGFSRVFSGQ